MVLRYSDYFQDHFFGIDKEFNLHVFKIDAYLYVKVLRLRTINLKIKIHELD